MTTLAEIKIKAYPVGSYLITASGENPNTIFPGTTWVRVQNRFLRNTASPSKYGQTGGASSYTLTRDNVGRHTHTWSHTHSVDSHTHSAPGQQHRHSVSPPSHTHTISNYSHTHNSGAATIPTFVEPELSTGINYGTGTSYQLTKSPDLQSASIDSDAYAENTNASSISTNYDSGVCATASVSVYSACSGQAIPLTPPYQTCCIWQRTA